MDTIIKDKRCNGCGACVTNCSMNAITMVAGKDGFLYPRINKDLCVNCGRCVNSCPLISHEPLNEKYLRAFAVQANDSCILKNSSSGGAFSLFANIVLDRGGGSSWSVS